LVHLDRDIDHEQLGADDAGKQAAGTPPVLRPELRQRELEKGAQGENDILHGASLDEQLTLIGRNMVVVGRAHAGNMRPGHVSLGLPMASAWTRTR
jgi:hypothetical protein